MDPEPLRKIFYKCLLLLAVIVANATLMEYINVFLWAIIVESFIFGFIAYRAIFKSDWR